MLDALRGVAALSVFLYHLQFNVMTRKVLGPSVLSMLDYGCRGVQVFFVLSGFVIAYSLRNTVLGPRSMIRFAIRRQFRLDPPYWAALGMTLLLPVFYRLVHVRSIDPFPGLRTIALNLLYVQDITRTTRIMSVSWTLCIEVQFYICFVLLLWLGQRGQPAGRPSLLTLLIITVTGIGSVLVRKESGWMLAHWCLFAAGVLCCWATFHRSTTWGLVLQVLVLICAFRYGSVYVVGTAAVLGIFVAGRCGALESFTGGPILQYLGRISYSLYLVHCLAFNFVLNTGAHFAHTNKAAIWFWVIACVPATLFAAHLFYLFVERPSVRWASRFSRHPATGHAQSVGVISDRSQAELEPSISAVPAVS